CQISGTRIGTKRSVSRPRTPFVGSPKAISHVPDRLAGTDATAIAPSNASGAAATTPGAPARSASPPARAAARSRRVMREAWGQSDRRATLGRASQRGCARLLCLVLAGIHPRGEPARRRDVDDGEHEKHREHGEERALDRGAERLRRHAGVRRARTGEEPARALGLVAEARREPRREDPAEETHAERAAHGAEERHEARRDAALRLGRRVLDGEDLDDRGGAEAGADERARRADPEDARVEERRRDQAGEAGEDEERARAGDAPETLPHDQPGGDHRRDRPEEDERRHDRARRARGSPTRSLHEERHERVDAVDRRAEEDSRDVRRRRLDAQEERGRYEGMLAPRLEPHEERETPEAGDE